MFFVTHLAAATLSGTLLLSANALPHLRRQSNGTISTCILDCMSQNDSSDGCEDFTDLQCICENAAFLQDVVLCTQKSCDSTDITEVLSVYIGECGLPATNDGSSLPNGASSFVPTNGPPGIGSPTMTTPTTGTHSTSTDSMVTHSSGLSPLLSLPTQASSLPWSDNLSSSAAISSSLIGANTSRSITSGSALATSQQALSTANTSGTSSVWSVDSHSSTRTSNASVSSTQTGNSSSEGPEDVSLSGGLSFRSGVVWSSLCCLVSVFVGASLL
ncbi:hypothetical protein C8Q73DRAFT_190526 [Cubamyces lactineus]|nr:hypothetical protein C8Q73DRAFT_190526 [Cubamyces lactineus]